MKIIHQVASDSYMEGTAGTQEAMWEASIETVAVIACVKTCWLTVYVSINTCYTKYTLDLYVSYWPPHL